MAERMQLHRLQQSESDIKMQLLAEQRQQRLSYDHQQAMQQFDEARLRLERATRLVEQFTSSSSQ